MITLLLATLALWRGTNAHSWIACTDYRVRDPYQEPQGLNETDPARLLYDDDLCLGYPRAWNEWNGGGFGFDRGFNYQASGGLACKTPKGVTGDYTERYPMARYARGQTVCVAHPTKNHVAAPCTNPYIPDHGIFFYITGEATEPVPSISERPGWILLHGRDGVHETPSYDYRGFQNAPAFCASMPNMDRATATACFDLPDDLPDGVYSFIWVWAFNSESDIYTTCWEAAVGVAPPPPPPRPSPGPSQLSPSPVASPLPLPTPTQPAPTQPTPTQARTRICFDVEGFHVG